MKMKIKPSITVVSLTKQLTKHPAAYFAILYTYTSTTDTHK